MYKLISVNTDPYKNSDLFSYQLEVRKMQLISMIINNACVKIGDDIISPSFKKGYDKRVTWYNKNNEPLGHVDFKYNNTTFDDIIRNYMTIEDIIISQIIK